MVATTTVNPSMPLGESSASIGRQTLIEARHRVVRLPVNWLGPEKRSLVQPEREPALLEDTDEAENQDMGPQAQVPDLDRKKPFGDRGETTITLYMREIGRIKLLTPQEEVALAARIQGGDREARDQMIKANLRLVVKIAKHYEGTGMPLLDLISEGTIGLMKAVERFDPSKGAKLSTYSVYWIRQAISLAVANQSRVTRLPMHILEKLVKMRRASTRLQEELGREPTDAELAGELGTTVFKVNRIRMATIRPVSLDAQVDGPDSRSYAETIADDKASSPYERLAEKTGKTMLQRVIDTLNHHEKTILDLRFGLNGDAPKTLEETGRELHLTDERVRQIQQAALAKLRRRIRKIEPGLAE